MKKNQKQHFITLMEDLSIFVLLLFPANGLLKFIKEKSTCESNNINNIGDSFERCIR